MILSDQIKMQNLGMQKLRNRWVVITIVSKTSLAQKFITCYVKQNMFFKAITILSYEYFINQNLRNL